MNPEVGNGPTPAGRMLLTLLSFVLGVKVLAIIFLLVLEDLAKRAL